MTEPLPVEVPKSRPRVIQLMLLAAPGFAYLAVLSAHAINAPGGDDYLAIFGFLARWRDHTGGAISAIGLLFEQFFSHRIPFTRMLLTVLHAIFGAVDLRILLVVAWTGWGLLFASLVWTHRKVASGLLWLLPVSFLLMQPQGVTNLLGATGSPGHAWTLLFGFWSCQLTVQSGSRALLGALACALGAAMCTPNGLLIFPLLAAVGCWRRNWKPSGLWFGLGLLVWLVYLNGYSLSGQPLAADGFSVVGFIGHAAVTTGGIVAFGTLPLAVITVAGLLLLAIAGGICGLALRPGRLDAGAAYIGFILLSVAMIAYTRNGWSAEYMLQDRYRLYPVALIAVIYARWAAAWPPSVRVWATPVATVAAAVFAACSYAETRTKMLTDLRERETSVQNYLLDPTGSSVDGEAGRKRELLRAAVERGDWCPPTGLLETSDVAFLRRLAAPDAVPAPSWRCQIRENDMGYLLEPDLPGQFATQPDFGLLVRPQGVVIVAVSTYRARYADMITHGTIMSPRFGLMIPTGLHSPGPHVVHGIRREPSGRLAVVWSAQAVCTVAPPKP